MRRCLLASALLVSFAAGTAQAQNPVLRRAPEINQSTLSIPAAQTPANLDLWFYQQQWKNQQDPKQAIRRRAERRAHQRENRLAALKWYGCSNTRPMASHTPFTHTYSPRWTGPTGDPFRWQGSVQQTIVVPPSGQN